MSNLNKIDAMAYVGGLAGNLATIPQIIKAWQGPTTGLAILTWVLFIAVNISWLVYAMYRKQTPLLVTQIVGIVCNTAVVVGWLVNSRML